MVRYRHLAGQVPSDPPVDLPTFEGFHYCKVTAFSGWAKERLDPDSPTALWLAGHAVQAPEELKLGGSYWSGDDFIRVITGLLLDGESRIHVRFNKLTPDGKKPAYNFYLPATEFLERRTVEAKFDVEILKSWAQSQPQ